MKTKLLLSLGIALLAMSCTSETESQNEDATKITKIYIGAEKTSDATTKTVTDVTTNSVKWAEGDEIAVFHVNGSGRNDYKRFVLESGAGEASAYFKGVGADDYLTAGETYKVVYPYAAVGQYDGVNDVFNMHANISASNNTDHLANHNWLVSTQQRITPADGTMPSFLLKQVTALAKIRVDIENFTITGMTNKRFLSNVNFTIIDRTKAFRSYIYWDDNLDVATYEYSEVATAGFSGQVEIKNNNSYYYWVPIIQNASDGIKKVSLSVHWRKDVDLSSAVEYMPKSVFTPGKIYNIHLKLTFTENSGDSGTLTFAN